jgi:hypothetical protein
MAFSSYHPHAFGIVQGIPNQTADRARKQIALQLGLETFSAPKSPFNDELDSVALDALQSPLR